MMINKRWKKCAQIALLSLTIAILGGCATQPKPATQPVAALQPEINPKRIEPAPASSRAPWTMHFIAQANQPLQNLTVPHGKVLVIEYISARYRHENAVEFPSVNYRLSVDESNYYFPVQGQGSGPGGAFMEYTGPARIYALPGANIQSLLQYPEGSLEVSLSGYIVSLSDF